MPFRLLVLVALGLVCASLWLLLDRAQNNRAASREIVLQELPFDTFAQRHLRAILPEADGFDWPLALPHGEGITITEGFLRSNSKGEKHVGENWKAPRQDGSPGHVVHATASGLVLMAMDFEPPWGGVVSVVSRPAGDVWPPLAEVVYAHLTRIDVAPLTYVERGQPIGIVAGADDDDLPDVLHWEVRPVIGLGLGPTYTTYPTAWIEPRAFVAANRPEGVSEDDAYGKMVED